MKHKSNLNPMLRLAKSLLCLSHLALSPLLFVAEKCVREKTTTKNREWRSALDSTYILMDLESQKSYLEIIIMQTHDDLNVKSDLL